MRTRCRFGIHEWEHLGYEPYIDVSWGTRERYYAVWRACVHCGKRHRSRDRAGSPPEVEFLSGNKYIDHSKKRHQ